MLLRAYLASSGRYLAQACQVAWPYLIIMKSHTLQFLIDSIPKKESFRVLIAGSKQNPIFPSENPDIFVGAHGGIFHADRYPETTLKFGVVSNWFLCSQATYCDTVRTLIRNVHLDYLIVIESIPNKFEDISPSSLVRLSNITILRLTPLQCTLLELRFLWHEYFICLLTGLSPRKLLGFALQLFTERTSYLTRLSTGMFSVLYFHHFLPPKSKVYVTGIGLQLSGSYFFDHSNKMQKGGHYAQDLFIANKLVNGSTIHKAKLEFTDSEALQVLAQMSDVPFIHYFNRYLSSISI